MRDGVGASDLIRWCTVQDVVRDTLFSTIYAHARIGSGFALDDSCYGDAEPKSPIMFASFIVNANHSIV